MLTNWTASDILTMRLINLDQPSVDFNEGTTPDEKYDKYQYFGHVRRVMNKTVAFNLNNLN